MNSVVQIKNLTVVLGSGFEALTDINLELPKGKIIGFIGPSGAGKTTLMRSIVGRQRIASGSIEVLGMSAGSVDLRDKMSYMTQELSVYSDLTVNENLKYFVTMAGKLRRDANYIINDVLESVDMTDRANNLVRNLSSGQKQRVSLAIALIGAPKLIVLDEPTVGLDPVLRENLWDLFAKISARGTTLIISSHSMDEAERCDYLVLIRDGKVIANSTPRELLKLTNTKSVEKSFLKLVGDKA